MAEVTELFPGQLELQEMIERVKRAQLVYANYPQEKVDEIFRAAAIAANNARISLAQDAVAETGMGIIEDKVIKNHFAAEYIFHKYKDDKTCGIIEDDMGFGIKKIAEPKGVICGIIPTTNPTSTAIFKSLIALKTRNAIIFSPHPRAKKCTCDAARIVLEAAVKAGAPEDIIAFIEEPTMEKTDYLMKHPLVNLILATGGPGMVKSAYSSGKPAIGVGAGNTPALLDKNCNIKMAVASILMSKTFDNGVVCASEQAVVVHKDIYNEVKKEFKEQGAHFLTKEELALLEPIILDPKRGSVSQFHQQQKSSSVRSRESRWMSHSHMRSSLLSLECIPATISAKALQWLRSSSHSAVSAIHPFSTVMRRSRIRSTHTARQLRQAVFLSICLHPRALSETSTTSVLNHLSHSDAEAGETTLYQRM